MVQRHFAWFRPLQEASCTFGLSRGKCTCAAPYRTNEQIEITMTNQVPLNGQSSTSGRDVVAPRGVISAVLAGLLLLAAMLFLLSLGATLEVLIEKYYVRMVSSKYDPFLATLIPATSGTGIAVLVLLLLRIIGGWRRRRRVR
jgi:hypothetical protein